MLLPQNLDNFRKTSKKGRGVISDPNFFFAEFCNNFVMNFLKKRWILGKGGEGSLVQFFSRFWDFEKDSRPFKELIIPTPRGALLLCHSSQVHCISEDHFNIKGLSISPSLLASMQRIQGEDADCECTMCNPVMWNNTELRRCTLGKQFLLSSCSQGRRHLGPSSQDPGHY